MKVKKLTSGLLILGAGLSLFTACKKKNQPIPVAPKVELLDDYAFTLEGAYPEGLDFDQKNNRFVISSFNKGEVYTLSADGKIFAPLINDAKLVAALGVYTDEENDRVIVVSGDAGVSVKSGAGGSTAGQVAYIGFYNAKNGSLLKSVDLRTLLPSGGVFPNDIAVDKEGNTYITSSFSPNIFKITKDYNATIFATNNLFSAPSGSFGLNGIVYHPDGYLIVAHTQGNTLYKVNIANAAVTEITGLDNNIKAPDGLEWSGNNLVVIENGLAGGKAHLITTNNAWLSASKAKEVTIGQTEFPTTAFTTDKGVSYVLTSYLGKLLSGDKTHSTYQIKGVKF